MLLDAMLMLIVLGVTITDVIILGTIQKLQNIQIVITTPETQKEAYQQVEEYPDIEEDKATNKAIQDVAVALQSFMLDKEVE